MAWGGPPPKGGEESEARREMTGVKTGYLTMIGGVEKTRWPPRMGENAVRAGTCLSKVWRREHDGLQGLSGWQLQAGDSAQQDDFPASGVPVAHRGWASENPSARTAIRIWRKVFKRSTTLDTYSATSLFQVP
jgi:hypothetical protein